MTAIGTLPVVLGTGIHASRPSASAVGKGGLYSCTTHGLVYQTDGSSWTTWATLGVSSVADADVTFTDITTNNASTSKHGFLKKLDNSASHFMDGTGAWSTPSGSGGVGNLWKMSLTSSQTLTNATATVITWDRGDIDGGSSVIDLANDRFVVPATGFYQVICDWLWESTAPLANCSMAVTVGGTDTVLFRVTSPATFSADSGYNATQVMSLTSGAFVKMTINPQAVTGCTARGNASARLSTSMTLIRIT